MNAPAYRHHPGQLRHGRPLLRRARLPLTVSEILSDRDEVARQQLIALFERAVERDIAFDCVVCHRTRAERVAQLLGTIEPVRPVAVRCRWLGGRDRVSVGAVIDWLKEGLT